MVNKFTYADGLNFAMHPNLLMTEHTVNHTSCIITPLRFVREPLISAEPFVILDINYRFLTLSKPYMPKCVTIAYPTIE